MNMEMFIDQAKAIYNGDNTGHDYSHIERVIEFCRIIHEKEGGNWDVIVISALFHDVHRVMSNKAKKYITPSESISTISEILTKFKLNGKLLKNILYIIEHHDNKTGERKGTIELQILQDADLLDSIGEIGLERTIKYCNSKNIPIYDKKYPLDSPLYKANTNPISATHYVYRTMLEKAKLLNTNTAKEIADPQIGVLKDFIYKNSNIII